MRLTLRTMLAYMDEILEPDDAQLIGRKIDESEFATRLLQRTQDSIRRSRLATPHLMGRGIGVDPNSVASYLDHTLPNERVPEFEKICLESDVHLAEVASCHQILCLVLPEPADTAPINRERLYKIGNRVDAAEAAPSARGAAPPVPRPARKPPEVPAYLRENRSRSVSQMIALGLLAVLLFGCAFLLLGPKSYRDSLAAWFKSSPSAPRSSDLSAVASQSETAPSAPIDTDLAPPSGTTPASENPLPPTTADLVLDEVPPADVPNRPAGSSDDAIPPNLLANQDTIAALPPNGTTAPGADASVPLPPNVTVMPPVAPPGADAALSNLPPGSPDMPPAPPAGAVPVEPGTDARIALPPSGDTAIKLRDVTAPGPSDLASATPVPPAPPVAGPDGGPAAPTLPSGVGMARYIAREQGLLLRQTPTGDWQRVADKAALEPGERLLILPAFKASASLGKGITVDMTGPAELEIGPPDADGSPTLQTRFGQFSIYTAGGSGSSLRLGVGPMVGKLAFNSADAMCELTVVCETPPGSDPRVTPPAMGAEILVATGQVTWTSKEGAKTLAGPIHEMLLPGGSLLRGETTKRFISENAITTARIDKLAIPLFLKGIEAGIAEHKPISLILSELADDRHIEVRALALRCGCFTGNCEPAVAAIATDLKNLHRSPVISAIHAALANSPESAQAIRAMFDKKFGDNGEALFTMLCGYTSEQLAGGADQQLVGMLNHEQLPFRVMAIYDLRVISGINDSQYIPNDSKVKRAPHVRRWQENLKSGKVRYNDERSA